jgi:hypothetical protein
VARQDLQGLVPSGSHCGDCCAALIDRCPTCSARILGADSLAGAAGLSAWKPTYFCDQCGSTLPWIPPEGRIWELENLLDGDDLDEPARLQVKRLLDDALEHLGEGDAKPTAPAGSASKHVPDHERARVADRQRPDHGRDQEADGPAILTVPGLPPLPANRVARGVLQIVPSSSYAAP